VPSLIALCVMMAYCVLLLLHYNLQLTNAFYLFIQVPRV